MMRIIKVVALTLLFIITAPTVVNTISSFYNIDSEFVCCEKQTEEEKKENKSEKELDDIEEYLLSENKFLSQINYISCSYTFGGKHFTDIVSDIIIPPPEA